MTSDELKQAQEDEAAAWRVAAYLCVLLLAAAGIGFALIELAS